MANILIIDDNKIVGDYLEACGHCVITALNGTEGKAQLKNNIFDVIIADIFIPQTDGYEVLMSLDNIPYQPRIIVMTPGYATHSIDCITRVSTMLSADVILVKPTSKEQLINTQFTC